MTELSPDTELRYKRIRRVKRLLRPMPRRTNLEHYPILKYFANYARKSIYIWSFKRGNVSRAIYIGWFIALIPMYGAQMAVAFLLCLLFRANCLVAMALQWITNPITIPPILYGQFLIGQFLYIKIYNPEFIPTENLVELLREKGFEALVSTLTNADTIIYLVVCMLLGGVVISIFGAVVTDIIYRLYAARFSNEKNR